MKKIYLLVFSLIAYLPVKGQQIKLEVKFSEPFAVFEFIQKLSEKAPPNPFKSIFTGSEFNTEAYKEKISAIDSIPIDYSYEFPDYPSGQKIGESTASLLKRNLFYGVDLDDFKIHSLGLIPSKTQY